MMSKRKLEDRLADLQSEVSCLQIQNKYFRDLSTRNKELIESLIAELGYRPKHINHEDYWSIEKGSEDYE